nr:hypothetical protein [Actinomycetales bacterium]
MIRRTRARSAAALLLMAGLLAACAPGQPVVPGSTGASPASPAATGGSYGAEVPSSSPTTTGTAGGTTSPTAPDCEAISAEAVRALEALEFVERARADVGGDICFGEPGTSGTSSTNGTNANLPADQPPPEDLVLTAPHAVLHAHTATELDAAQLAALHEGVHGVYLDVIEPQFPAPPVLALHVSNRLSFEWLGYEELHLETAEQLLSPTGEGRFVDGAIRPGWPGTADYGEYGEAESLVYLYADGSGAVDTVAMQEVLESAAHDAHALAEHLERPGMPTAVHVSVVGTRHLADGTDRLETWGDPTFQVTLTGGGVPDPALAEAALATLQLAEVPELVWATVVVGGTTAYARLTLEGTTEVPEDASQRLERIGEVLAPLGITMRDEPYVNRA